MIEQMSHTDFVMRERHAKLCEEWFGKWEAAKRNKLDVSITNRLLKEYCGADDWFKDKWGMHWAKVLPNRKDRQI